MINNDLVHVPGTPEIDLSNWECFEGKLGQQVAAYVSDALINVLAEEEPAYITIGHADKYTNNKPSTGDPATLFVTLPLGTEESSCKYACTLESVIDWEIEDAAYEEEDDRIRYRALAARLRELANKIDAACIVPE